MLKIVMGTNIRIHVWFYLLCQVRAISYWHGFGNLESQPNTIFLSTQSIHPAFHQQIVNPIQIYTTPNTSMSICSIIWKHKKNIFYDKYLYSLLMMTVLRVHKYPLIKSLEVLKIAEDVLCNQHWIETY